MDSWNDGRAPKRELLDLVARVAKAVANPTRLELLDLLAQAEKNVDLLATQAGLSVTSTSNHLKELRLAGLVTSRRSGSHVFYRLADPSVHTFVRSLQDLARQRLAEVDQVVRTYYEEPDALDPISAGELLERMRADEVIVLDVRPRDEYRAGHIPGSVSVPVGELGRRLAELPRDREVVAYCRGPYCVYAVEAVATLREAGFTARRLAEGIPGWREQGMEIET